MLVIRAASGPLQRRHRVGNALPPGPLGPVAALLGFILSIIGLHYAYGAAEFKVAFPIIYTIAQTLAWA